jgi:hypothetical protein
MGCGMVRMNSKPFKLLAAQLSCTFKLHIPRYPSNNTLWYGNGTFAYQGAVVSLILAGATSSHPVTIG